VVQTTRRFPLAPARPASARGASPLPWAVGSG
jgi:hypothetical protein